MRGGCVFPRCTVETCRGLCQYAKPVAPSSDQRCGFPKCGCSSVCTFAGYSPVTTRPNTAHSGISALKVMRANGRPCPYCKHEMDISCPERHPSREHVQPLSRGGRNVAENVILACKGCNASKGSMELREWVEHLIWSGDRRAKHVADFMKSWENRCNATTAE